MTPNVVGPSLVSPEAPTGSHTNRVRTLFNEYWGDLGDDKYAPGIFDRLLEQCLSEVQGISVILYALGIVIDYLLFLL